MKNEVKEAPAKKSNKKTTTPNNAVTHEKLHELFVDGLKDIYWAEKALTKALPKMIRNATAEELVTGLTRHLEEVFESIDEKAVAKKCPAMEGLIKEAEEVMSACEEGGMRDAGIIVAGQKVEHYEIATYGTLRAFAEILGHNDAARLLLKSLGEEKAADDKLTEVTVAIIKIGETDKAKNN
jgi:ferritin-like metal-binding protein YciE